jgi:hypothetical protein
VIVVPEHCVHRCVLLQLLEEVASDDVARVEDDVGASERGVEVVVEPTREASAAAGVPAGRDRADVRVREDDDPHPVRRQAGVSAR